MQRLDLLVPEWQGYGESNSVRRGALELAGSLKRTHSFVTIEVAAEEELAVKDGVLGLSANLRMLDAVRAELKKRQPQQTFLVGGTCASEIGPVSYLNQKLDGDLAVLWFDAHGDLNTPESSPSGHFHGMPLRTLLGEGHPEVVRRTFSFLRSDQVVLAGTRDLDPPELAFIAEKSIPVLPPSQLSSPDRLVQELEARRVRQVYVHLDLDVLDPEEFPHLLVPSPGGISCAALTRLLMALSGSFRIVGFSVVEYVPAGLGGLEPIRRFVEAVSSPMGTSHSESSV